MHESPKHHAQRSQAQKTAQHIEFHLLKTLEKAKVVAQGKRWGKATDCNGHEGTF